MPAKLEYFSPDKIALMLEIRKHPELIKLLAESEVKDWEEQLAGIAAYCGIVVDGAYTEAELDRLCAVLIHRLQEKRTLLILPVPVSPSRIN